MPLEVFGEGYHQFVSFDAEVLFKNVPSKKNPINITLDRGRSYRKTKNNKNTFKRFI